MMFPVCSRLSGVARRSARFATAARVAPIGQQQFARRWCASSAGDGEGDGEGDAAPQQTQDKRRVWRWGATKTGRTPGSEQVTEVSGTPTLVEDVTGVTFGACGHGHGAFVADGAFHTYGSNKYNQLGRKTEGSSDSGSGAPPGVVSFELEGQSLKAVSGDVGAYMTAVITEGGELWTWGWGGSFWSGAGGLGNGARESAEEPLLIEQFYEAGEKISQVACGLQHTVVLTTEGRLYVAGKGEYGRLGLGDTSDQLGFEEITYFSESNDSVLQPDETSTIVKIDAGNNFGAALSSSGELWLWGRNDHGQLGLGEEAVGDMYSMERFPRLVQSLPNEGHKIVDFACGEHHVVALTASGGLWEWGARTWLTPRAVSMPEGEEGLKDITKVAAGEKCSFALSSTGTLYSWGPKSSGCLGLSADVPTNVVEPTPIPAEAFGHQKVVDIFAGKGRCLAVTLEDTHIN